MKFLVDAQLPRRFASWLQDAGHDALHTLDLPKKNRTSDSELIARAMQEGRVVISKDADFVQSFLVNGEPRCCSSPPATFPMPTWRKFSATI